MNSSPPKNPQRSGAQKKNSGPLPQNQAPFNLGELAILERLMNMRYSRYLKGKLFEIDASYQPPSLSLVMTLRNEDESFYYPVTTTFTFEGRNKEISPRDASTILMDYITAYFHEYFQSNGEVLLPIDDQPYSFRGAHFLVRGQIFNKKADDEADALLKEAEERPTESAVSSANKGSTSCSS